MLGRDVQGDQGNQTIARQKFTESYLEDAQECLLVHLLASLGTTMDGLRTLLAALATLSLARTVLDTAQPAEPHPAATGHCFPQQEKHDTGAASPAACSSLDDWLAQLAAATDATSAGRSILQRISRRHSLQVSSQHACNLSYNRWSPCCDFHERGGLLGWGNLQVHGIIRAGSSSEPKSSNDGESAALAASPSPALGLPHFNSLAAFAEAWCSGRLPAAQLLAAAGRQALAYLTSGAAVQLMGMAQLLFWQPRSLAQQPGLEAARGRLRALTSSCGGADGPALGLQLCFFRVLCDDWGGVTARLAAACQDAVGNGGSVWQDVRQLASSRSSVRLPLHFAGAHSAGLRPAPQAGDAAQQCAGAAKRSPASGCAGRLCTKRRKLGSAAAADAEGSMPEHAAAAEAAGAAAREAHGVGAVTARLAEELLGGGSAAAKPDQAQAAALAVHPALAAEAATRSFGVCRAYLPLLLRAAQDARSLQPALAGLLHMLRLGGRPAQLTQMALLRCTSL